MALAYLIFQLKGGSAWHWSDSDQRETKRGAKLFLGNPWVPLSLPRQECLPHLVCKDQKQVKVPLQPLSMWTILYFYSIWMQCGFLSPLCSLSAFSLAVTMPTQLNSFLTQLRPSWSSRSSEMPLTMDRFPNSLSICANLEILPGRHSTIKI